MPDFAAARHFLTKYNYPVPHDANGSNLSPFIKWGQIYTDKDERQIYIDHLYNDLYRSNSIL